MTASVGDQRGELGECPTVDFAPEKVWQRFHPDVGRVRSGGRKKMIQKGEGKQRKDYLDQDEGERESLTK